MFNKKVCLHMRNAIFGNDGSATIRTKRVVFIYKLY